MASSSRPRSLSRPGARAHARSALIGLALACGLLTAAPAAGAATARTVYAVVVSADVPMTDITLRELRQVMLGERRFWSHESPISVLVPATGSTARRYLVSRLFHLDEQSYRRHTLGQLYRGEIDYAPMIVSSDQEALAFVVAGRGAISIVPWSELKPGSARVLRVGGRLPPDEAYELAE